MHARAHPSDWDHCLPRTARTVWQDIAPPGTNVARLTDGLLNAGLYELHVRRLDHRMGRAGLEQLHKL